MVKLLLIFLRMPENTSNSTMKNSHQQHQDSSIYSLQNPEINESRPIILSKDYQESHENMQYEKSPRFYYEQYKRIYAISHSLHQQKLKQQLIVKDLIDRIKNIQNKQGDLYHKTHEQAKTQSKESDSIRRARRTAEEIERKFRCEAEYCDRWYGSQGSLQQHIKLKHPHLDRKQDSDRQDQSYKVK